MQRVVWIEQWEWECCGEPFSVGDELALAGRRSSPDWQDHRLGALTHEVSFIAVMHQAEPHSAPLQLHGTVATIREVELTYAPKSRRSRDYLPIPGSTTTTERNALPQHEHDLTATDGELTEEANEQPQAGGRLVTREWKTENSFGWFWLPKGAPAPELTQTIGHLVTIDFDRAP